MAYLHSIYLTGESRDAPDLSWRIAANIESLKTCHPDVEHRLLGDESLRAFIAEKFGRDVVLAYDQLAPLSYKADLGRYCLLFENGGVYADLSAHFFAPAAPVPDIGKLHVFRDAFSQAPWIVSTSVIAAPAGLPLFQHCIEAVLANVRSRNYGANPLCPTGPNLFGAAIARHVPLEDMVVGDSVLIRRDAGNSRALVDSAGEVVAVIVKTSAGIASLGGRKAEDYNALYSRRTVYGELERDGARWSAEAYERNRWVKQGLGGFGPGDCIFGPYADLEAGAYEATVFLEVQQLGADQVELAADVVAEVGQTVLAPPVTHRLEGLGPREVRLPFSIDRPHSKVEFRLTFGGRAKARVLGSGLVRTSAG